VVGKGREAFLSDVAKKFPLAFSAGKNLHFVAA